MNISIVNPLDYSEWDTLIRLKTGCSFFHSSAWAEILIRTYSFKPFYFIKKQADFITTVLPLMETSNILGQKKTICLPFSDFCEPLYENDSDFEEVRETAFDHGKKRNWQSIEIRGGKEVLGFLPYASYCYTHEIPLIESENVLFNTFRNSTKRNITKAKKENVTVVHENTKQALQKFYALHCLNRHMHGLPPQPLKFFINIYECILKVDKGFITTAYYQKEAIASNMYFVDSGKALYKYGSLNRKYQGLRPSNLVMWEGIRQCKESGAITLNLGRTESHHTGLLQFKRGFGAVERVVNCYKFAGNPYAPLVNILKSDQKLAKILFPRMPIWLLKLCGKMLYKYSS